MAYPVGSRHTDVLARSSTAGPRPAGPAEDGAHRPLVRRETIADLLSLEAS